MSSSELNKAMLMLASEGAIFMGQGVAYPGHSMFKDLDGVPARQRIELPVAEELQLGMATGMAIEGLLPVAIYPRCDFIMRAMDQLVLHLDKIQQMSCGQWNPKVIIRTRVGGKKPLDAGPQHTNDFTDAFRLMLTNIHVDRIDFPEEVMDCYKAALVRDKSTLVVEKF